MTDEIVILLFVCWLVSKVFQSPPDKYTALQALLKGLQK